MDKEREEAEDLLHLITNHLISLINRYLSSEYTKNKDAPLNAFAPAAVWSLYYYFYQRL